MSTNREAQLAPLFAQVQRLNNVESASGGFVPLPPSGDRQGDYLFIDCVYDLASSLSAQDQVEVFRRDAERVFGLASGGVDRRELVAVCVSFYSIPGPGSNLRLYRASVDADGLSEVGALDFRTVTTGEESSLKDVHALLLKDRQGM